MSEAPNESHRLSGFCEERLAALAATQHAVFALEQLHALGLTTRTVNSWAARARLHRIHRGVYSLIPRTLLKREGHWMAGVLACGDGAALSRRSGAALQGLRPHGHTTVEVTLPTRARSRPGISVHLSTTLSPNDVTRVDNIPCTTVARTLLDLAEVVSERQLERALDQAEVSNRFDLRAIEDQLERNRHRPAAAILQQALAEHRPGQTPTWSELEEQFLRLIRVARLPEPEVNAWITLPDRERPIRVDFLWRRQRVIVETDGYRTHKTRQAFEQDRRNDQRLAAATFRVIRPTYRHLRDEPRRLQQTIGRMLGQQAPRGAPG